MNRTLNFGLLGLLPLRLCRLLGGVVVLGRLLLTERQQKHNRIISNPVFVSALSAMQGPDLDIDTLWWMVQWGNEYLARFKRDATPARKRAHAEYKRWTANTRQKQMAGFSASLRSAAGDDSLDQSQND